jgi:transposase
MTEAKKQTTWVGLDVGKLTFYAALDIMDKSDKYAVDKLPTREFKRTKAGVGSFLKWLKNNVSEENVSLIMEATGCYSIQLTDWLNEQATQIPVCIQNGRQMSDFIKSLNIQHKTDKTDAQAIARFGTDREPAPKQFRDIHWRELQELERERTALIEARVKLENRTESLLVSAAKKINGRAIAALNLQIKAIDKEIKRCVVEHEDILKEVHIITTAPGVQFVSACCILAELGSLKQYTSRQISAISGLSPRIMSSGTSVNRTFLGRRGSKRLRQILYLNSMWAVAKIPQLNAMHKRLVEKGKTKMTARCACMRKLLLILRAMVENGKPYDENFQKDFLKNI